MRKSNIRINLYTALLFLFIMIPVAVSAQSPEEIETMMDNIKLDESMVYGEDFNDNRELAQRNALAELLITVNEIREEQGKGSLSESDLKPVTKVLQYSRDGRHFVMLYLPTKQMMSLSGRADTGATDSQAKPTPAPRIEHPTKRDDITNYGADDILDALCGQDNWVEIKGFLTEFKKQGKIKDTGAVTAASEVPEDAYSILIDDLGGILSLLSPKSSTARINYRTNQPDNESNYNNCKFIVWYR